MGYMGNSGYSNVATQPLGQAVFFRMLANLSPVLQCALKAHATQMENVALRQDSLKIYFSVMEGLSPFNPYCHKRTEKGLES